MPSAGVNPRKEYMTLLIVLSRGEVDACAPFLEGIPEEALHNPDSSWWGGEERKTLFEAMSAAVSGLGATFSRRRAEEG